MCLHVSSNSDNPEDYTNVDIAACDGSDRQKWHLSSKGEIIHLPSGKCLDADGNNDNEVELYSCLDVAWQKWDLRGKTLRNRGLGRCLDIKNCPGESHRSNSANNNSILNVLSWNFRWQL